MIEAAPELPKMDIFLMEWRHETPKLMQIYDSARDPGWSPNKLPWDTLKPEELTPDQRYAISYWFALLAVFSRAVIHTYFLPRWPGVAPEIGLLHSFTHRTKPRLFRSLCDC
jgi:hypothetical protein